MRYAFVEMGGKRVRPVICLATGALIEFGVGFFKDRVIMWPASGVLTGNSTAFILRTPGTLHGDWWSLHGIWIFIGVVAISMASNIFKYPVHRQRFPAVASAISWRVASGLSASRAAAVSRNPGVQYPH